MPVPCTLCANPKRGEIDAAVHAGTSFRAIGRTYGLTKDVVGRHARACLRVATTTRQAASAARKRSSRIIQQKLEAAGSLKPIESPEDVIADLQRLRVEAFNLFEGAKARSDWKQAQMLFSQLVQLIDRFGEMHRVLGSKGVTVNVDARQMKVAALYDSLPLDVLRRLKDGETTIESVLGHALEATP